MIDLCLLQGIIICANIPSTVNYFNKLSHRLTKASYKDTFKKQTMKVCTGFDSSAWPSNGWQPSWKRGGGEWGTVAYSYVYGGKQLVIHSINGDSFSSSETPGWGNSVPADSSEYLWKGSPEHLRQPKEISHQIHPDYYFLDLNSNILLDLKRNIIYWCFGHRK